MPKSAHKQVTKIKKHLTKHVRTLSRYAKDHFVPHTGNGHQPHVLKHHVLLGYTAIILLLKVLIIAGYVAYPTTDIQASAINQANITAIVNTARTASGLQPLTINTQLENSAKAKALDMAKNGYFSHTSPTGLTPWYWIKLSGYRYSKSAENLAVHYSTTEDVQTGWMTSPSHRKQILNPEFTETGVGVAEGVFEGVEATFVVQYFAIPTETLKIPNESATSNTDTVKIETNETITTTTHAIITPSTTTSGTISMAMVKTTPITDQSKSQISLKPVKQGIEIHVTDHKATTITASLNNTGTALTKTSSSTFVGTISTPPVTADEVPKDLRINTYDGQGLAKQQIAAWFSGQQTPQAIFGIDDGQNTENKLFNIFSAQDIQKIAYGIYALLMVFLCAVLALNIAFKLHTRNIKTVVHTFSVIGLVFVLWAIN